MSVDSIKDESQESHRQAELGGVMTPKNDTIIYLSVTTAFFLMSIGTAKYEYVPKRAPVDTPKPSYQPTSSYLISTPRTSTTSAVYPSAAQYFILPPKRTKTAESIHKYVNTMHSKSVSSISVSTNPPELSDHNNL